MKVGVAAAGLPACPPRTSTRPRVADARRARRQRRVSSTIAHCFAPPLPVLAGAPFRLKVIAVNCISSQVWSPQYTSFFGSGFALFAVELSYHAVVWIFVPFGMLQRLS